MYRASGALKRAGAGGAAVAPSGAVASCAEAARVALSHGSVCSWPRAQPLPETRRSAVARVREWPV